MNELSRSLQRKGTDMIIRCTQSIHTPPRRSSTSRRITRLWILMKLTATYVTPFFLFVPSLQGFPQALALAVLPPPSPWRSV